MGVDRSFLSLTTKAAGHSWHVREQTYNYVQLLAYVRTYEQRMYIGICQTSNMTNQVIKRTNDITAIARALSSTLVGNKNS